MQIGLLMSYAGGFHEAADSLVDFEAAGLDLALLPEAYSFDSVSQLGYLAARTTNVKIATAIINVYSRSPALIAMTAAGLDFVSQGRFVLGIGASGPQVVEGFHGVPYTTPLRRIREVVGVCRAAWRRDPVELDGRAIQIPLTPERGATLPAGRPLRLINHPVRSDIPIILAALGPKSVEAAAEICEGWLPTLYYPEAVKAVFGASLDKGLSRRPGDAPPLDILVDTKLLISEDPDELAAADQQVRDYIALYVGGMGARGKNFYNTLVQNYGFDDAAATIEDLYRSGRKAEAAAAIPEELVRGVSLVGPRGFVAERIAALRESGVTGINAAPLGSNHRLRVDNIAALKELTS